MRALPWPLPALLVWVGSWALFLGLRSLGLAFWLAATLASGAGACGALVVGSRWRRIFVALGFPLSAALSATLLGWSGGPTGLAWIWLVPLLVLLLVYPLNAWRDAPLFPTPLNALQGLAQAAPLAPGARILDAGCGLGHGLNALRLAYPHGECYGIEWSWPLRLICGLRCPWARVRQGDIWQADWSGYDMVYLFQRPESMPRAAAQGLRELSPGAWLVSLEFEAVELQPNALLQTPDGRPLWLYQAPLRRVTA